MPAVQTHYRESSAPTDKEVALAYANERIEDLNQQIKNVELVENAVQSIQPHGPVAVPVSAWHQELVTARDQWTAVALLLDEQ